MIAAVERTFGVLTIVAVVVAVVAVVALARRRVPHGLQEVALPAGRSWPAVPPSPVSRCLPPPPTRPPSW